MAGQLRAPSREVAIPPEFPELLGGIDGVLWEADARTFAFTYVSPQSRTMLGYEPEEWLASPTFWADHLHPADRDWAVGFCVAQTGQSVDHEFEYRFVAKDGRVVWVRDLVWIVRDAEGRPARLRGLLTDITARKGAELRLAVQQECTSVLALADTVDQTLPAILRAITTRMGWPTGAWWTLSKDGLKPSAVFTISPAFASLESALRATTLALGDGIVGRAAQVGRAEWTADIGSTTPVGRAARAVGLDSSVAIPVRSASGVIGVLQFAAPGAQGWNAEDIAALAGVAAQLGMFIDRERAQLALRERDARLLRETEAAKARLDTLIEATAEGIYGVDTEGVTTFMNEAALKMTGLKREEAVGRKLHRVIHHTHADGRDYPPEECPIYQSAHGAPSSQCTADVFWRVDGTSFPVEYVTSPMFDGEKPIGAVTIFKDVTARRKAEETRDAERRLFTTVLEQLPAGAIIAEMPTGKLILANKRVNEILGHDFRPADGMVQYASYDLRKPDGSPLETSQSPLMRSLVKGETVIAEELHFRRPDGAYTPLLVNSAPVKDGSGKVVAGVATFIDIAERKQFEEELRLQRNLLAWQRRVLESIATGEPLKATLDVLCRVAESQSMGKHFTVLLADEKEPRLRHGAAPSLPEHYNDAVDGIAIGEGVGSCGTAAFRREAVVVSDIETDPLWKEFKGLALPIGLRACWSTPILGSQGQLLGTWAVYSSSKGDPEPRDQVMISVATKLAAIAIERAQAEAEVRYQRDLISTIADNTGSGLFMMDAQGYPMFLNDAAKAMTGYASFEEIKDRPLHDSIHRLRADGSPLPREECLLERANVGIRELRDQRDVFCRKDGSLFPVAVNLASVEREGALLGTVLEVRDITEELRAENELRQRAVELTKLTEALQRSNAELDQFAYVTSHDLKAPLRGIANISRWIEEDLGERVTPESAKHLELLRGRVRRMESLIDAILEYSRIGRVNVPHEQVDVKKLITETVDLISPPAGLRIEMPPALPTLATRRTHLQQVFMNLIGNAVKHHDKPAGTIRIDAKDLGPAWEFSVADDGPGISPRFHEKIFVIFQTLQPRDKVEGTGVGLALVKKLIESQGGKITLESDEGKGAVFRFTWPKRQNPEAP